MSTFQSLATALKGQYHKQLAELSSDAQRRIQQDFAPWPWDSKTPRERCNIAKQWDFDNNPATREIREGIEALTNADSPTYSEDETHRLRGDYIPAKPKLFTNKDLPSFEWSLDAAFVTKSPSTSKSDSVLMGNVRSDDGLAAPKHDWRMLVQAEAYQQWVRLTASGANPTIRGICDWVAQWCINKGVRTDSLKVFPNAEYLRTHVLSGKLWTPPYNMSVATAKKHVEQMEQMEQTPSEENFTR